LTLCHHQKTLGQSITDENCAGIKATLAEEKSQMQEEGVIMKLVGT